MRFAPTAVFRAALGFAIAVTPLWATRTASAQSVPSQAQAEALLRARPELLLQLRQRIQTSGLSAGDIRARLQAAGYPEALLDQAMGEGRPGEGPVVPGDSLLAAARTLGIVDSLDAARLRRLALQRGPDGPRADSVAGRDSTTPTPRSEGTTYAPDGSTIFGLDLFARSTTLFDPNLSGPVDASYRLGPGDQIVLILTGNVEEAHTLDVTREGFVVIPTVGQVPVANLSLGELDAVLRRRLSRVYSGVGTTAESNVRFSVSVARLRSNQVFVVGDVAQPGSYRISSAGTALTALYAAGGPSIRGSLRGVEIRRRGRPAQVLDVYAYLLRGDATGDVRLESGDVVFVPTHGPQAKVRGAVLRPATYELKAGESMADMIASAGGFAVDASQRRLRVRRLLPAAQRTAEGSDHIVVDVALPPGDPIEALATVPVEAGDDIEVLKVADRVRRRVTVTGNVWQPGDQGLTPGLTLTDALRHAGGLKPDTYLGRVVVSRLRPDSTREQVRAILTDVSGTTLDALTLQEDDEVRVFSLTEFRAPRYVAIHGAISRGGQYPWRDGMTLRDLVLEAGGLHQSASVDSVEIARRPQAPDEKLLARALRLPLDSSYFARDNSARVDGEVTLQPYDHVLIFREPGWNTPATVHVTGEVKNPGVFTLLRKDEHLVDVIRRAGGLTGSAYAAGIVFTRGSNANGRVGVDLPSALRDPSDRDNLLLLPGDSIHVPRYNALVEVRGAVNSPLAVPFAPGKNIDHYISAAGGSSRLADPARAYVQQGNGKVESRHRRIAGLIRGSPKPGPGSVVYVPERDPNQKRDAAQVVGAVASALGSLVTIIVVLAR
ncbi:MAG: SLBB domain-containing protein [Gemmatimonadaceae bacterium]